MCAPVEFWVGLAGLSIKDYVAKQIKIEVKSVVHVILDKLMCELKFCRTGGCFFVLPAVFSTAI